MRFGFIGSLSQVVKGYRVLRKAGRYNPEEVQKYMDGAFSKTSPAENGKIERDLKELLKNAEPPVFKRCVDMYGCITVDGRSYYLGIQPGLEVSGKIINKQLDLHLNGQPVKVLLQGRPQGLFSETRQFCKSALHVTTGEAFAEIEAALGDVSFS